MSVWSPVIRGRPTSYQPVPSVIRVVIASSLLTTLYAAYSLWITPVFTQAKPRPSVASQPETLPSNLAENVAWAKKYLQPYPWTLEQGYQFRTPQAYIYTQSWEHLEGGEQIRFTPFALIWRQQGDDIDREPIRVVSQSAVVQFEHAFEISDPNPGRVISGYLEGAVDILGADGLVITGRNFTFSEASQSIWTDHSVDLVQGPNRGHADGMDIKLVTNPIDQNQSSSAIAGIREIKFRRGVELDMLTDVQNPTSGIPLRIRCRGSLVYDVAGAVAMFDENVVVNRGLPNGDQDILRCETLKLFFVAPQGEEPESPEKIEPKSQHIPLVTGIDSKLTLERIEATEAENVKLQLVSQANGLKAWMTHLQYHLIERVITLTDSDDVVVVNQTDERNQRENRLRSSEIELQHDENQNIIAARCRGAGKMWHRNLATEQVELAAQWKKQLRMFPDRLSGLRVLELEGEAVIKQPHRQVGLAAEKIRAWVREDFTSRPQAESSAIPDNELASQDPLLDTPPDALSAPETFPADESPSSSDAAGRMQKLNEQVQIDRVLALTNVAIVSPRLTGEGDRLEVLFEDDDDVAEAAQLGAGLDVKLSAPADAHASKRSRRQLVSTAQTVPPKSASDKRTAKHLRSPDSHEGHVRLTDEPVAAEHSAIIQTSSEKKSNASSQQILSRPLFLRAERIRVHVRRGMHDQPDTMSQIFTSGEVLVKQPSDQENADELEMTGATLSVINSGPDQEILHVEGQPAQIRRGQMVIEGGNISIDRRQNQSVVDGTGRLLLPVKNGIDGKSTARPGRLEVRWDERMNFDGLEARFYGLVQAHLDHNIMHCQEMRVHLNEKISFTDPKSGDRSEPAVERVHCLDGVDVESSEYEGSQLLSIRRAHFWEFSLNQTTGETHAMGPGFMTIWERGKGKRAALTPSTVVLANRATQADAANWEYTRVDFYGKSVGNVKRNNTKFTDRVEVAYGPVQHPLETVDPDHLGEDGGWLRCQELQVAHVQGEDDDSTHIELLGKGNAELEGRTFHGMADQISFDESKGLYMLRSLGQHKATLWRQAQIGGERSRSDAQRMDFIPAKDYLRLDGTTSLDAVE